MRMKSAPLFMISFIVTAVVLIAGCSPGRGILPGKKCAENSDCGQAYCSKSQREMVSSACQEGRCKNTKTECGESEICVQDSIGVRCSPKDPDTGKPILGCSINSTALNTLGINSFNPAIYMCGADCPADSYCTDTCYCEKKVKISCSENTVDTDKLGGNLFESRTFMCGDDCPADYYCSESCYCEEKEKISCSENTADTETFGENIFSAKTEMCGYDCPRGSLCSGQCLCYEYDCPDPVFENLYWTNPSLFIFDFKELNDMWADNPMSLLELGDEVDIYAIEYEIDGVWNLIPFPDAQLTLVPNPDNEYIHEEGWQGYCVNDYYEGGMALDINSQWLTEPVRTCSWGPATKKGILTICPEILIDWFKTYNTDF